MKRKTLLNIFSQRILADLAFFEPELDQFYYFDNSALTLYINAF